MFSVRLHGHKQTAQYGQVVVYVCIQAYTKTFLGGDSSGYDESEKQPSPTKNAVKQQCTRSYPIPPPMLHIYISFCMKLLAKHKTHWSFDLKKCMFQGS